MSPCHVLAVALLIIAPTAYGETITADQAPNHIGQQASVCGVVASAKHAKGSSGQPTFLNLDKPYPQHIFTAVIWGSDRAAFSYPPQSLLGKQICVHGVVTVYRGKAEIVVTAPSQITTHQVSKGDSTSNASQSEAVEQE
jgi:hypothetical protein